MKRYVLLGTLTLVALCQSTTSLPVAQQGGPLGTPSTGNGTNLTGVGSHLYTTFACTAVQNVTRYLQFTLGSSFNCTTTDTAVSAAGDNSKRQTTRAGTLRHLYCESSAALLTQSATLTVRANAVDTALACIITGTGITACSNNANTGTSTAGGNVSVSVVTSATSGTANYVCAFENTF